MRMISLGLALTLAACQPAPVDTAAPTPPATPAATPAVSPEPEQPAMQARGATFEAMSKTAEAVTGNITLTAEPRASADAAPSMKLAGANGLSFVTELVPDGALKAERVDWSVLFGGNVAATGNAPPGAPSVDVHRIVREDVPNTARNGGYCGQAPTTFIAMATGLEVQGQPFMSIAAFKGDAWPPVNETDLCGIYNYAPPAPR